MPLQWLRPWMPALLALFTYSAALPWQPQSSSRIYCWMQCDSLCSWGSSPAYDHRVIPASLCTPPRCTCGRLSGDDQSSSHMWVCCCTCSRCDPIHSGAHICCQGPRSCTLRLGTTLPPPWCPSWPSPLPVCSPSQQKQLMTQQFLRSASSPWWCGGSPATILGWGLSRPRSLLQIHFASSAGLVCLLPCTVREVLHGSSALPKTHFLLRHQRLICEQSSRLWWWCNGIGEPSPRSHSGAWLPWLCPWRSFLRSWS